ncbi:MAG: diguanylate cyclase domain-containing protein [Desulfonatronovibrio sp.]
MTLINSSKKFWILNRLPLGIFILDSNYRIIFWNKIMREWTGFEEKSVLDKNFLDIFPEADKPKFQKRINPIFEGGPPAIFSSHLHGYFIHLKTPAGKPRLQNTTVAGFSDEDGLCCHALFTLQDVTELNARILELRDVRDQVVDELRKRREIEERLRKEKKFVSLLLDTARALIILLDRQGKIIVFNRACEELTGYDSNEVENVKNLDFLLSAEDAEIISNFFGNNLESIPDEHENYWLTRDGKKRLISWSNSIVYDENGNPEYVLGTGIDITHERQMQDKIRHMAMHDALTGLASRNMLQENMARDIARAERHGTRIAVLFLDLDGFKEVNDSYGHSAGDNILQEVGQRLKRVVRASDTVARFGGDEFVVVIPEIHDYEDVIKVCDKIFSELSIPYHIGREQCRLGVSIGISMYPDDGTDPEKIIGQADKAMYQAKSTGRGKYCFYGTGENQCG